LLLEEHTANRRSITPGARRNKSWDSHGHGGDLETFGDGKKQPLPCCSTRTRASCSLSPAIRRLPKASGCSADRLRCLEVRYLCSSKSVGFRYARSTTTPPNLLGPRPRCRDGGEENGFAEEPPSQPTRAPVSQIVHEILMNHLRLQPARCVQS
jgi:hypothetical protein